MYIVNFKTCLVAIMVFKVFFSNSFNFLVYFIKVNEGKQLLRSAINLLEVEARRIYKNNVLLLSVLLDKPMLSRKTRSALAIGVSSY